MAAAAFMGLISRFEDQQRGNDAIAQANDGVANFAFFIKARNFEVELTQDSHGPIEPLLTPYEADIIPHGVLDRQPVLGDERRIGRLMLVAPTGDLRKIEVAPMRNALRGSRPGACSPNQAFEQGSAGEAVGSVETCASNFPDSPKPVYSRSPRTRP